MPAGGNQRRNYIDAQPFRAWLEAKVAEYERLYQPNPGKGFGSPLEALAFRCGTSPRTLYRYRKGLDGNNDPTDTILQSVVEDILHNEGSTNLWELYPLLKVEDARPEEFCFTCRAFVSPTHDSDVCPWCERPMLRPDLSKLPPRERTERDEAPALRFVHNPRRRMPPRPVYLDVLLSERKLALETFVETRSIVKAGEVVVRRFSNNRQSASTAVRQLLVREGWYKPPGRGKGRERAINAAVKRVKRALRDGTWDHVVEQQVLPSLRTVFDDELLHEALWLYHYDGLSFGEIAKRLLPRSNTRKSKSLKTALIDEFERRGWPKRTHRGAGAQRRGRGWEVPPEDRRCQHPGCRRWAANVGHFCRGHNPDHAAETREYAARAAAATNRDAVDVAPFRLWLEARLRRDGLSLLAFSKTVPVSYDWLYNVRRGNVAVTRRRTVDKVCTALGDTTFEDIFYPIRDDEEDRPVEDDLAA
jgi:hypothetical protein